MKLKHSKKLKFLAVILLAYLALSYCKMPQLYDPVASPKIIYSPQVL